MVAKAESVKQFKSIDRRFSVIALCETARGVAHAEKFAALDQVVALMWGAEDLVASLGGTVEPQAQRALPRRRALRARARPARRRRPRARRRSTRCTSTSPTTKRLAIEATDAAASGFAATACIHPSQVEIIRRAYRPDEATLDWAHGVLDAARAQGGVFTYEGRMVDEPVLRQARAVLARGQSPSD